METIHTTLTAIDNFILNWTTYFWSIPVWFIILGAHVKWLNGKVVVGDLFPLMLASLMNPVWYVIGSIMIVVAPFLFVVLYISEYHWDKIKNKKIF